MAKLKVEALQVSSFETTPSDQAESLEIHTRNEPLCYSPWCAPTVGTNCQTEA